MQYFTTYIVIIFLLLYFVAAFLYSGGSQTDINSTQFSWLHNYWCDLIWPTDYREAPNRASWVAIPAMFLLCIGVGVLFYQFPKYYATTPFYTYSIRFFGIGAMLLAALLFTSLHDIVIPLASLCGVIALIGIFIVLYQSGASFLFYFGLFSLFLLVLNNLIYYSGSTTALYYLPLLQKISVFIILMWIIAVDLLSLKS